MGVVNPESGMFQGFLLEMNPSVSKLEMGLSWNNWLNESRTTLKHFSTGFEFAEKTLSVRGVGCVWGGVRRALLRDMGMEVPM